MDKELLFLIDESFERNHIKMSEECLDKFGTYCDFLMEYNEKVNLTAAKTGRRSWIFTLLTVWRH